MAYASSTAGAGRGGRSVRVRIHASVDRSQTIQLCLIPL
jgi:hypothetical protein